MGENWFEEFGQSISTDLSAQQLEEKFKALAETKSIKPGELMLPFRIMLVGGKFGPGVFDIAVLLGAAEVQKRITNAIAILND